MKRLIGMFASLAVGTLAGGSASAIGNGDSEVMAEVVSTVHAVEAEFPEIEGSTVTTAELPEGTYAMTVPGEISISEIFARDAKKLKRSIEYDVAIGFHPPLGHCSAAQLMAYHEAAHLVDDSHDSVARWAVFERFGDGDQLHGILSGYSFRQDLMGETINPGEALAEAFAAVRCNGGNWAERELNRMLTD